MFGYPLAFQALRANAMQSLALPMESRGNFVGMTLAINVVITFLACSLDDLGLISSLGGAFFGAVLCIIFPGLMAYYTMSALSRKPKAASDAESPKSQLRRSREWLPGEKAWALFVVGAGAVLLFVGSGVVILKREHPEWFLRAA